MATYQQKRLPTQSLLSLHWSPQHPEPAETVATRARETMVEKERMVTGWLASARRDGLEVEAACQSRGRWQAGQRGSIGGGG